MFSLNGFWDDFKAGKFCFRIRETNEFNRFKRLCHNHEIRWANKNDPKKEILKNDDGSLVNKHGTSRFTIGKNNYYYYRDGALHKRRKINNSEEYTFGSIMTFDTSVFEDEIDNNGYEREL